MHKTTLLKVIIYLHLSVALCNAHYRTLNLSRELLDDEYAILQYDSRPLADYWAVSANWNNLYTKRHGHQFLYYYNNGECFYKSVKLADPWCKVKAMIQATKDYPHVRLFIYMDSDAVIDQIHKETSLVHFLRYFQMKLDWNALDKPIVFNQDSSSWWCSLVSKIGYTQCLNAGTVMWYRHPNSLKILEGWWDASMDPYETNPLKRKFRTSWPWEQDRQMYLYNKSSELIQISSHPQLSYMPRKKKSKRILDWCFSHLPGSGCFVSHFCADKRSKQQLRQTYQSYTEQWASKLGISLASISSFKVDIIRND